MVGDTMYGGRIFESGVMRRPPAFRFARQALHAFEITFVHPGTLETMTLSAPLPPDMTRLMEILRPPPFNLSAAGTYNRNRPGAIAPATGIESAYATGTALLVIEV